MRLAIAVSVVLAGALTAPGLRAQPLCDGVSPVSGEPLAAVRVAAGLSRPILATSPPGDTSRLFIVEQDGTVRILRDGALLPTPFLDIAALTLSPADGGGNEEGLLGMAFHPDYASNGWVFLYHTDATGANNLLVRYTRSAADPDLADPASREVVLSIGHPLRNNHNGGMIAFGPHDGYLYVAVGDGGGGCDPDSTGQDLDELRGKILRLDVDALPYASPPDNPFAGATPGRDEIWAYGLRNPWRFGLGPDGALYIGDVGQFQWEEIDYQPAGSPGGENYGWELYEASQCPPLNCNVPGCLLPDRVDPVLEYEHTEGCAVTGGPVYDGCRLPDLRGTYFYADYCSAFVRSFRIQGGVPTAETDWTVVLDPPGGFIIGSIVSFGTDARGEIHIMDLGGEVYRIVPRFDAIQVSGGGATPLAPGDGAGDVWSWEDLESLIPYGITAYRVYRSDSRGDGVFECIRQQAGTTWDGFDPVDPADPGQVLTYLVTAVDGSGAETSPGTASDGTLRSLSEAACP